MPALKETVREPRWSKVIRIMDGGSGGWPARAFYLEEGKYDGS
jgi:hypothetical protein